MARRHWLVPVLVAALVAASCSRGEDDGGDRAQAPAELSGPPVVLGLLNMENTPVGSFPELREGAEVAVAYVNAELGGVGGRPLRLEACATSGTPASSQACVNDVLGARPVAVLGGADVGSSGSVPLLARAGVPYVGALPTLLPELTNPMSFMLNGGMAAELLAQATYVLDRLEAEKVGIVHLDLPGLLPAAASVARTVLRRKGIRDVEIVPEKPDAPDFTPALTSATEHDPDVVLAVFPPQGCARVMAARTALGLDATMLFPGGCADEAVVEAGGTRGAEGAYFTSAFVHYSDTSNEDVATYRAELRQHGPRGARPSVLSQAGFSLVMDVRSLLGDVDGPVTSAALVEELRGARDRPSFMGHRFTCDGKRVPLLTSVCSLSVRVLQYKGGRFRDVAGEWVDGVDLVEELLG